MPPVAIAAGIGAVGSIAGGVISSNAAKSAAQKQADSAAQQIAYLRENRDYISGLEKPIIDRGNAAGQLLGNFYGVEGGDKAAQALATYRGSTGYQDLLNTGLGAVNANAYSRGLGASGATLKALQARGMALADQSAGSWLNGLNGLYQTGNAGIGNIAGVATQTTQGINGALQNSANASSNASLASGNAWSGALQNLGNIAGSVAGGGFGSSYGSGQQSSWYNPPPTYSTPPYAGFNDPSRNW